MTEYKILGELNPFNPSQCSSLAYNLRLDLPLAYLEKCDKFHCEQESSDLEAYPAKDTLAGDTAEGPAAWEISGRAYGTLAAL